MANPSPIPPSATADASVTPPSGNPVGAMLAQTAKPTPPPPPDVQWNCKIEKIAPDGAAAGEVTEKITVGEKVYLTCDGPSVHLDKHALSLEAPKAAQYMLRLLDARSISDTGAQFVATTYMVGDLDFKNPVLTDGKTRVGLGQFSLHSATVIKKEDNPENKPAPPWGSQSLPLPAFLWLIIAAVCAVIVLLIVLALRRSARLKKLRSWLSLNQSALSPFNQFNRDLRMLSKKIPMGRDFRPSESEEYFMELDRAFRFYLTRELDIYAVDANPPVLLRDLKRVHPDLYQEHRRNLGFVFKEISVLQKITRANSSTEAAAGTLAAVSTAPTSLRSTLQTSSVAAAPAAPQDAAPGRTDTGAKTGSVADAQQLSETCRRLADLIDRREKEKARGR